MALESQRSPKLKVVTQYLDYLDKLETYDSDVCSYTLISLSSSIPVDRILIRPLSAEI